jgi:putative Mg2+ transporter-C (MgtC) family protein
MYVHRHPGSTIILEAMHATVTWPEMLFRLLFTVLCVGVIGLNRDEHGRGAGLRTNLLVGLAACVAMIQANLLAISLGKTNDSFVVMDIMRLPLGILSGIGFIGAGAIIKRGQLIVGLTTAATLWFVTVMGLCFGGGQIDLGFAAFALGFVVLAGLKHVEDFIPRKEFATLSVNVENQGSFENEVEKLLSEAGIHFERTRLDHTRTGCKRISWKLHWWIKGVYKYPPPVIENLSNNPEIEHLEFAHW